KAGFNSMRQYIHLISNTTAISPMDTWKLCDADIRPVDGWQGAGGMYWTVFDGKMDLSLEGYWKNTWNVLDYKSGATLTMNDRLADDLVRTRGKAYGVEFMAKKTVGKLSGWASYSYSRTFLQEMEDRGINTINRGDWYSASYDKPHDFKLVANYAITARYSLSANVDYSTGRPVTIPVGYYYYGGGYRLAYSARNSYRIPDYFRLDLAINIDPGHSLKALTHTSITLGCYNVTGRKNTYSVYYSTDQGRNLKGYRVCVFATQIPYINLNILF
ncbi:MAG: TonB-dependent receptor, partial [Bacteroidales bacterium]|nr:TonB-dependent receptor [Bacteroidales bacterium]